MNPQQMEMKMARITFDNAISQAFGEVYTHFAKTTEIPTLPDTVKRIESLMGRKLTKTEDYETADEYHVMIRKEHFRS